MYTSLVGDAFRIGQLTTWLIDLGCQLFVVEVFRLLSSLSTSPELRKQNKLVKVVGHRRPLCFALYSRSYSQQQANVEKKEGSPRTILFVRVTKTVVEPADGDLKTPTLERSRSCGSSPFVHL